MEINDRFAREWKINNIPLGSSSFINGGTLLIGIADAGKYDVSWRDQQQRLWTINEIPLVGDAALEHDRIDVSSAQKHIPCRVRLSLVDNRKLEGRIDKVADGLYTDGPVGTFTAEANSGEEIVNATRQEERIAV